MIVRTAERMRDWRGPALLSYGFRPFFLLGAGWAALAMALWIAMLAGWMTLPTRFDPIAWHAHEFLFGYLGAILAGFLLTAVPNWTGRLPVIGPALGGLTGLWLAGRIVIASSNYMPASAVALVDLAFPVTLGAVILREILAGRNWRNLPVLALLVFFTAGNALFHWQAASGTDAAGGSGLRLGLATAIMMISLIGGRIVPSFTRNWLVKAGDPARPAAPMQTFDKGVLLVTILGLLAWVVAPNAAISGIALILLGALHATRLLRWQSLRTGAEPLLWVLHVGYAFVPLGALAIGTAILLPDRFTPGPVQHLWMAGAIGLMTLAVMTRATLGHTGQALTAGPGTIALYLALIASVAARLAAGGWPDLPFLTLAAVTWIGAFGGFAAIYGPLLLRPKPARG